jgi:tetratricopeptide (TPR) repeat protein
MTGAGRDAADAWDRAVAAYNRYAGDPVAELNAAIADSPGFAMAHVLKGYMHVLGSNPRVAKVGGQCLKAVAACETNARERRHAAALTALVAGPNDFESAASLLAEAAAEDPRDIVALQIGQTLDFLLGDSARLRDRIAAALPAWTPDMPGYHAIQGMLAFGLEETGDYAEAEAAGRLALDLEPRNGWARHAVAHVMEMQDRRRDGIAFMRADIPAWTEDSFFSVHNWWHLALFHLGEGDVAGALEAFDGPIWGERSDLAFDMADAAALLWRLHLMGADVGDRWNALADLYERQPHGAYAFDDAHAMMAFTATGRTEAATAVLAAVASPEQVHWRNVAAAREVGLPLVQAIEAFGQGAWRRCIHLLADVRGRAAGFGGSHAQRDIIDLTLIEAARRAGDGALETRLRAERAAARTGRPS